MSASPRSGWRGAGPALLPLGLPGPGRVGLGTRAGVPRSRRMLRNPRRTLPGDRGRAGSGCFSQGRRRSAARGRARRSWAWAAMTTRAQRSAWAGVRTFAAVRPRVPAARASGSRQWASGPPAGRTAVLAGPGGRVLVEDAAGREPDQDVDRAAGQPVGQGGGAVAGVEGEQRHRPARNVGSWAGAGECWRGWGSVAEEAECRGPVRGE
jgi:hypothetical protein